jgi:hypothetical protein
MLGAPKKAGALRRLSVADDSHTRDGDKVSVAQPSERCLFKTGHCLNQFRPLAVASTTERVLGEIGLTKSKQATIFNDFAQ